ncbi:peptide deformylase, mitochondrial-like isoform X2 [Andrena cerasifolii]|uniref:peptide deformylase, mitochondrial-like isoform X2 n=1 Tax=Andrena cerasifolii TaxID=2819439 RepID=UPI004037D820
MATAMFNCTNIISRCVSDIKKSSVHYYSLHKVKKVFSKYFLSQPPEPPYDHICQLGDPVLRTKATSVDTKVIQTHEFQKVLGRLEKVMKKHQLVGISAPQIGLPWQVCAIEVTEQSLNSVDPEIQKLCESKPLIDLERHLLGRQRGIQLGSFSTNSTICKLHLTLWIP